MKKVFLAIDEHQTMQFYPLYKIFHDYDKATTYFNEMVEDYKSTYKLDGIEIETEKDFEATIFREYHNNIHLYIKEEEV